MTMHCHTDRDLTHTVQNCKFENNSKKIQLDKKLYANKYIRFSYINGNYQLLIS